MHYRVVLNLELLAIAQHQRNRDLRSRLLYTLVLRYCSALLCVFQLFNLIAQGLHLLAERSLRRHHVLHARILRRRSVVLITRKSAIAVTEKWIVRSGEVSERSLPERKSITSLDVPPRIRSDSAGRRRQRVHVSESRARKTQAGACRMYPGSTPVKTARDARVVSVTLSDANRDRDHT